MNRIEPARFATLLAVLLWISAAAAADGERTIFLVAKPGLPDPNFRESVVLVKQGEGGEAAGVIINRPTNRSLASILPGERFKRFTEPVFFGGPVTSPGLVAVYRAQQRVGDSITMLPGVFLALQDSTLDELLHSPPQRIRFYAGLSGWAPGQLEAEIGRGDWFVLDADADTVFARDTDAKGLWTRLLRMARTITAGATVGHQPIIPCTVGRRFTAPFEHRFAAPFASFAARSSWRAEAAPYGTVGRRFTAPFEHRFAAPFASFAAGSSWRAEAAPYGCAVAAFAAFFSATRSKLNSPALYATRIASLAANLPSRICLASGFSMRC